jgi:hypothetical protein
VSVLLPTDTAALYQPGDLDPHGWREEGTLGPYWEGECSLQLAPGVSDGRAAAGGGHGPHGPAVDSTGVLFLPPELVIADGMTADIRGRTFVLSQTRLVKDPLGGLLDCWTATVTTSDTWPAGGERNG